MESAELSSASSWLHWLSLIKYIGGAMVVIGVAAELLGDWFSEPLQKKLDDARKLEIAKLTTEGQRLSKEAETAKAAIAEANARAVEAQLALEKFKAPRVISDKRRPEMISMLKPFAGMTFDVVTMNDPEPFDFANQLDTLLSDSGWKGLDRTASSPQLSGHRLYGMAIDKAVVVIFDPKEPHQESAARTVVSALALENIDASAKLEPPSMPKPSNTAIHLVIGRKQ